MSDEVKAKRTKGGRPRIYNSSQKRPTMAFRIRGDLHKDLIASAADRERSLSEEIERRLTDSFDAEALEAMLRRVVRQEVERALDMPITPGPVTIAAMEQARSGKGMQRFETVDALMADLHADDALAVMADAQH